MSADHLSAAVDALQLDQRVDVALQTSVVNELSIEPSATEGVGAAQLARLGFMYEVRGLSVLSDKTDGQVGERSHRDAFRSAMACWSAIASKEPVAEAADYISLGVSLSVEASLALRIAVSGLASSATAETRLRLKRFDANAAGDENWLSRVESNIAKAFVCLARKDGGWRDIGEAITAIEVLRSAQKEHEEAFLNAEADRDGQTRAALLLVGYYHLAQMVTSSGEYLRTGGDGKAQLSVRLDMHHRKAGEAFGLAIEHAPRHFADLIWLGCGELMRNSLWSHLEGTSEALRAFGRSLISEESHRPVLELWPSQQEALQRSLLDGYQRAILVEMPTSAGKTLLAKFAIAQTKALNPAGQIAYIVPTRALVNQVTLDLRTAFSALDYVVELAVPAYEIDPTEAQLLGGKIDVLVTTPEKLDLLLRSGHSCVSDLSLVVADEAHNLQEEGRGARLELLLGTIKRERRDCRFLLLSPFLPNGKELVTWLGDDRHLPPIKVNWRPSKRIVAASLATGRMSKRKLSLEALPAADNVDIATGTLIPIGARDEVPVPLTVKSLSAATARALQKRGGVLILCRGKGTASNRARELAENLEEKSNLSPEALATCEYLDAEAGYQTVLAQCIRKGVAFHHAGLSQEAKWLVERLISRGEVEIICGTTTLAQGVNFPISTVIIETLRKGRAELTYSDFWNIAGRAGRALVDTVGVVAFPAKSAQHKEEFVEFLKGEALAISSQLSALLVAADEIGEQFNLANLRAYPQLSSLLQFLAHAVRVADGADIADELEIVLRSSLVYHQTKGKENLSKFVKLCRAYVRQVSSSKKGMLALADTTGFATPSVFHLMAQISEGKGIKDPQGWLPSSLFGSDISALERRLALVAGVPEMKLGDGTGGPLDTVRTAKIIRDWVNGDSIALLSEKYAHSSDEEDDDEEDEERKIAEFSSYLYSTLITNASWGIGALEGLCLADQKDAPKEAAHVPSMIYFGVNSTEAVWLRMAGLPRIAAEGAANLWRASGASTPTSYKQLRDWVSNISESDWSQALPSKSSISAKSMKIVWKELAGA